MEDITILTTRIRAICRRLYSGHFEAVNKEGVLSVYNSLVNSNNIDISRLSIELYRAMEAAYGIIQTYEMVETNNNSVIKK